MPPPVTFRGRQGCYVDSRKSSVSWDPMVVSQHSSSQVGGLFANRINNRYARSELMPQTQTTLTQVFVGSPSWYSFPSGVHSYDQVPMIAAWSVDRPHPSGSEAITD